MTSINDIKKIIIEKTEKLLLIQLEEFKKTEKISSSQIGINIGKIINEELKEFRNNLKKNIKEKTKEKTKENIKDYKTFMRETMDNLKKENELLIKKRNILDIFQDAYNKWKKYEKDD